VGAYCSLWNRLAAIGGDAETGCLQQNPEFGLIRICAIGEADRPARQDYVISPPDADRLKCFQAQRGKSVPPY
jgi:hypothetical protein